MPLHRRNPHEKRVSRFFFLAVVTAFVPFANAQNANAQDSAWRIEGVERVIAIADVHGDFHAMRATLSSAGVIDDDDAWAAGRAHLVVNGDLLDRGPDSRLAMDLTMRLEEEAEAAGGAVHTLLGNHELMNLVGDLRYVADEEYAAFADDEDPADRERWFRHFVEVEGLPADDAGARSRFADRYPPGFFGHRRAFRSDGIYGAWLLDKPLLIVVNSTAFAHAGLSPTVAQLGLEGANDSLMAELRGYVEALDKLVDAGVLDPAEDFYRHGDVLEANEELQLDAALTTAVEDIVRLGQSFVHEPDSPAWYRGNVGCPSPVEQDRLTVVLDSIDATRVVIGHTPTITRRVLSRLDGKVIEIDTGMFKDYYRGSGQALIIEGDSLRVIGETGLETEPVEHPRRVGLRRSNIDDTELERILVNGDVTRPADSAGNSRMVKVKLGQVTVDALFIENPRGKDLALDLAAYRLDRFLNLDMVPVTVAREVDGKAGVLQFLPAGSVNETQRREAGAGGSAWCPLPDQWNAMYIFDALIHNPGRPQANMLYSRDNWQIILNGNENSFGFSKRLPAYLDAVELSISPYWIERLSALDDAAIEARFSDVLDRRRIRAMSGRRDRLLEEGRENR